jgi:hypothetical protein
MRGLSAGVRSYQRDVARGKAGFRRIIFEFVEFVKNLSYHSTTMPPSTKRHGSLARQFLGNEIAAPGR